MRPTPADLHAAIQGHASRVERFRRGEFSGVEFTPIRLGYGLYYQLDHTSYMQRIKLPGGLFTAEQADVVAGIADDMARGVVHVTTRQDVQLHWIPIERVIETHVPKLIEVNEAEAKRFGCNAVVVGKSVVTNTGCEKLGADLRANGYSPIATPLDEFLKAGGSAKCLTLRLDGEEAASWKSG